MLEQYKIRIDTQSYDLVQKLMDKYAERYLYTFEKIGTPDMHVHIYMETRHKEPAIRRMIRSRFGSGNGVYSMKRVELEPIEYLAYCVKAGKPTHNLGDELIEKANAHDEKVKLSLKAKKESRRSQLDLISEFVGEEKELDIIIHRVIDYYREKGTLFRRFFVQSVAETIWLQNNPDYAAEMIAIEIYNKIITKIN